MNASPRPEPGTYEDAVIKPAGPRERFDLLLALLVRTGFVPTLAVAIGGASYALLIWNRFEPGRDDPLLLVASMAATAFVAMGVWVTGAAYLAKRQGLDLVATLRRWSISAGCWILYPVLVALPLGGQRISIAISTCSVLFAIFAVLEISRHSAASRDVLLAFALTRLPIIAIAEIASVVIGARPGSHAGSDVSPALAVWGRWDAVHYLDIARRGYKGTEYAFFPLFPLLVRALGTYLGSNVVGGLVLSNFSYLLGLFLLRRLVLFDYDRETAQRALFYISIFPSAIFFSAIYTESLFFLLTIGAFVALRDGRWLAAGALGGLASATRIEGILFLVPFAIEFLRSPAGAQLVGRGGSRAVRQRFLLGLGLAASGFLCYVVFLAFTRGDPLYFSHVQSHWNRSLALPWVSITRSIVLIATSHESTTVAIQSIELTFTVIGIAILAVGYRLVRTSYMAYAVLSLLVPLSTSSLMSTPRFELVIFPLFIVLAVWGARIVVNTTILALCLPLLGLFTVLFADWYWIA